AASASAAWRSPTHATASLPVSTVPAWRSRRLPRRRQTRTGLQGPERSRTVALRRDEPTFRYRKQTVLPARLPAGQRRRGCRRRRAKPLHRKESADRRPADRGEASSWAVGGQAFVGCKGTPHRAYLREKWTRRRSKFRWD